MSSPSPLSAAVSDDDGSPAPALDAGVQAEIEDASGNAPEGPIQHPHAPARDGSSSHEDAGRAPEETMAPAAVVHGPSDLPVLPGRLVLPTEIQSLILKELVNGHSRNLRARGGRMWLWREGRKVSRSWKDVIEKGARSGWLEDVLVNIFIADAYREIFDDAECIVLAVWPEECSNGRAVLSYLDEQRSSSLNISNAIVEEGLRKKTFLVLPDVGDPSGCLPGRYFPLNGIEVRETPLVGSGAEHSRKKDFEVIKFSIPWHSFLCENFAAQARVRRRWAVAA